MRTTKETTKKRQVVHTPQNRNEADHFLEQIGAFDRQIESAEIEASQ